MRKSCSFKRVVQFSAAQCLRQYKAQVIALWQEQISESDTAAGESPPALLVLLPHLLDDLIAALSVDSVSVQRSAVQNYPLRRVISEYDLLVHTIFAVLDGHESEGVMVTARERNVIIRSIQSARAT